MQAAHRVAKNTLILYARMAITVFISLYSTRLILAALGVSDFGLFNVVGGVISMLGFLNASMAAATQRFISFAQGEGDLEKVKRIFNMSSLLHWGIAILVFFVLEVAGYFFFNGILNISPDRVGVAKIIYQFMIVSTLFTVISVPYEAVITSHENMLFFAILGVAEAILKLLIAFCITYSAYDHLILYGFMLSFLSLILLIVRALYCQQKYVECKLLFKKYFDKLLLIEIAGFGGWSLLGSLTSMMSYYGQGVLLNIYFGTQINAAQGIAAQISGQISVFALTLSKALNPIIDKAEGIGDRKKMIRATLFGTKVSFFLLSLFYIPFLLEMPNLLKLWLKNVPESSVIFCSLLLCRNLIEQLYTPLSNALGAVGTIKYFQIYGSLIYTFTILTMITFFKLGYPAYTSYLLFIFFSIIHFINVLFNAHKYLELSVIIFFKKTITPCFISFLLTFFIVFYLKEVVFFRGINNLIIVFLVSLLACTLIFFKLALTSEDKLSLKNMSNSLIFNIISIKKSKLK